MMTQIAIVIIGRNEGDRLRNCLRSAIRSCTRAVYVDSDSTDDSTAIAAAHGVETILLTPPNLTAARGRQAGLDRVLELWPDTEFVQFIDGDCELVPGWIERGLAVLLREDRVAAVSGIRSEASISENTWSRLVDIEWSRIDGEVLYPGGDSLCRISALMDIGGWSCDLIAGEDPDLGFRLTEKGWKIRRLAVPMTIHDIRITRFSQYWRRAVRSGWAYGLAGWRNRRGVGKFYFRMGLKFTLHALGVFGALLASVLYWPACFLLLLLLSWILFRAGRFAYSKGLNIRDSLLYSALTITVRFAQARGFLASLISIARGSQVSIIEYHSFPGHDASSPPHCSNSPPACAIAYISACLPALSETFVYNELLAIRDKGWRVIPCSVFVPKRHDLSLHLAELASEARIVYSYSTWARCLSELLLHPICSVATLDLAIRDSLRMEKCSITSRIKVTFQAFASLGLARKLRSCGIRHIHAHMANTPTTIAMYSAKQLGISFSFAGHANDLFVHRSLLKEKIQRAGFVACISEWHKRFYQSVVPIDNDKLPIIRCGVDVPRFDDAASLKDCPNDRVTTPFSLLSVGRLVDKKGMDTLIRAIASMHPNHLVRCQIIGDGPLKTVLQELIQALGVQDKVHLRGSLPNTDVLDAVRNCDLFVLACQRDAITNDQDGIPVSLMEAMAQSRCVVTTELEPITELVQHEKTGLCVPERNSVALGLTIERVMKDSFLRNCLAGQGRAHVEKEFSRDENANRLINRFSRLIVRTN